MELYLFDKELTKQVMLSLTKNETFDFEVEDKKDFLVISSSSINTKKQLQKLIALLQEKFLEHKEQLQAIRNKENKHIQSLKGSASQDLIQNAIKELDLIYQG